MRASILPQHDPVFSGKSLIESAIQKAESEIGWIPQHAFWNAWALIATSNIVAGIALGAFVANIGGAIAGSGLALMGTLFSSAVFVHVSAILGGLMSRTTAACSGAFAGICAVNLIRPFDGWELNAAMWAGAGASFVAASAYREYLSRAYGCSRWRLTTKGLLVRTMLVAMTAAWWTVCSPN